LKLHGAKGSEVAPKDGSNSLLNEDIDDNMVGDFSKSHNKKDHRMMNGKFDWLLKASSPLYTAAKTVSGQAQHQITKVMHTPAHVKCGASLQEEGNATATEEDAGTSDAEDAAPAEEESPTYGDTQGALLDFSKEKEGIFFATWIVVLVVVLAVLGLCVFYARSCLGAPESHEVPAGAKKASLPGGGGGYGSVR